MAFAKLNYLKIEDNIARQARLTAVDPADDSVDQADSNFPVSNMQLLPVSKPGRIWNRVSSSGTGSMNLQVSFTAAQSINVIALVGHNLSSSATITLNGGSSFNPTSSQGTMTWRRNVAWHYFSAAESHKYWNIEISDEKNAYGFAQIGYLVMGTLTELDFGYSLSSSFADEMIGLRSQTETAVPINRHLAERYRLMLEFQHETTTDISTLRSLFLDLLGPDEPALFIPYTSGTEAVFGRINQDSFQRVYSSPDTASVAVELVDDPTGVPVVAYMPVLRDNRELPDGSSFTRQTVAYYKNEHLELVEVGSGVLRTGWAGSVAGISTSSGPHHYDYDEYGTLLEPARTNALSYGQDLSVYTLSGVTVASASTDEPKATASGLAYKIEEAQASGAHQVSSSAVSFTADTVQAVALFLKASERTECKYYLDATTGTSYAGATIDLSAATIASYAGNSGILQSGAIESYANSWYRVNMGVQLGSGVTNAQQRVLLADATSSATYSGVSGYGLYAWNFQHEADKSFSSSPILTSGATSTRNADLLYAPFDFDTQTMSVYVKYIKAKVDTGTQALVHIGGAAAAADPRLVLYETGSEQPGFSYDDGINSRAITDTTVLAIGDTVELLGVLYPDGTGKVTVSQNGGAASTSSAFAANTFPGAFNADRIYIGSQGSTVQGPFVVQEVKTYRGVQTLEFMREL